MDLPLTISPVYNRKLLSIKEDSVHFLQKAKSKYRKTFTDGKHQ
jgi:hypothetical protein